MKRVLFLVLMTVVAAGLFAQDITLARPPAKAGLDVVDAIKARSAAREFIKKDISVADMSAIVWAGNGLKGPDAMSGRRHRQGLAPHASPAGLPARPAETVRRGPDGQARLRPGQHPKYFGKVPWFLLEGVWKCSNSLRRRCRGF